MADEKTGLLGPVDTRKASGSRGAVIAWILGATAVLGGGVASVLRCWTTDDAFISFRYARNLVRGLGLVFNAGERVEGYSNFLWTLWSAVALRFGLDVERWTWFWGIFFYLASIALLFHLHLRLRRAGADGPWFIPIAALAAAASPTWNIYATGGLETSLFTFLILAGYLALTAGMGREGAQSLDRLRPSGLAHWIPGSRIALTASLCFTLAALTRPEGVLFLGLGLLYVFWQGRPRLRTALLYAGPAAVIGIPYTAWRIAYFGDVFPNTYYAKSASSAWYSQGILYAKLHYLREWGLLLGPLLLIIALLARRGAMRQGERPGPAGSEAETSGAEPAGSGAEPAVAGVDAAALALVFWAVYLFYVVRVGGDFMHGRFLVPVTPFCLIALEVGAWRLLRRRPIPGAALAAVVLVGLLFTPFPIKGDAVRDGVANEWLLYTREAGKQRDREGAEVGRLLQGLPARFAFIGAEARLAYAIDPPYAIDAEAGLTDRTLARRLVDHRGRVGHEKRAPVPYLIQDRKVHFVSGSFAPLLLELDSYIPPVDLFLGRTRVQLLHWDANLVAGLRQRGVEVPDLPSKLDSYIRTMANRSNEAVSADYPKFDLFYFYGNRDPVRQEPFRRRLSLIRR